MSLFSFGNKPKPEPENEGMTDPQLGFNFGAVLAEIAVHKAFHPGEKFDEDEEMMFIITGEQLNVDTAALLEDGLDYDAEVRKLLERLEKEGKGVADAFSLGWMLPLTLDNPPNAQIVGGIRKTWQSLGQPMAEIDRFLNPATPLEARMQFLLDLRNRRF